VVDVLRERGLLDGVTNEAGLRAACAPGASRQRAYCGFDPTADSLHAGNLLGVVVLAWFQRCGHTPVALVGGATGRVGDPSGKSSERPLLDEATLEANVAAIGALLTRLLPAGAPGGGGAPLVLNNMAWFGGFSLLDFLRAVGRYARVGVMLSKDSVKARMTAPADGASSGAEQAEGMSFTEFSYQLLQAFDFAHLFKEHGVTIQVGGSDQWGNITAGTDLIRRAQQRDGAFGAPSPVARPPSTGALTRARGAPRAQASPFRCCCAVTARSSARRRTARCGSQPPSCLPTPSTSTGCASPTRTRRCSCAASPSCPSRTLRR